MEHTVNQTIFHLANQADAQALSISGSYHTASLGTEGFIHCCTAEQLPGVIQRYYTDAQEVVLLEIDATQLNPELVYENTVGGEELFPHVYGEINKQAVQSEKIMDRARIVEIANSGKFQG